MEDTEIKNNVENELSDSQSQQYVISTFGKIFRITLLWLTFPIWSVLRAVIKTLATIRQWYICRMRTVWSGLKAKWALAGEKNLVDIKWYDKKWFITMRKILFPIDWAIHIVIGTVIAPFKFIKSFFLSFRTAYRITKDICSNKPNEYCYTNGDWFLVVFLNLFKSKENKLYSTHLTTRVHIIDDPEIIEEYIKDNYIDNNAKKIIYVEIDKNKKMAKKDHIWESSIPVLKYINNDGDKSIFKHIQAILGLNSIKPQCDANKFFFKSEKENLSYTEKVSVLEESEK